jgi:hypothetical protein
MSDLFRHALRKKIDAETSSMITFFEKHRLKLHGEENMRKKANIPADLLKTLNYSSTEEAALDILLLSARSRYAEFSQEVKRFEEKYEMDFDAFQSKIEALVNEESFESEEDLMAWKFAHEAAAYWRQKIEELEHVAGAGKAVF